MPARRRPQPARSSGFASVLLGVVSALALVALGLFAYQRLAPAAANGELELPLPGGDIHVPLPHVPSAPMRVIYLNREGATLTGGTDDSAHNVSSIVRGTGKPFVHIPPFQGSLKTWNALVKCIRGKFAPFNVAVVEERPIRGRYIMAVVGGTSKDLGPVADHDGHSEAGRATLGLAPFNGHLVPDAVVLVFAHSAHEQVTSTCETAGMEIAHTYGLDHELNCRDLMTYMRPCGARTFVNAVAHCGEEKARACEDGTPTQNSYAKLYAALGPAPNAQRR